MSAVSGSIVNSGLAACRTLPGNFSKCAGNGADTDNMLMLNRHVVDYVVELVMTFCVALPALPAQFVTGSCRCRQPSGHRRQGGGSRVA